MCMYICTLYKLWKGISVANYQQPLSQGRTPKKSPIFILKITTYLTFSPTVFLLQSEKKRKNLKGRKQKKKFKAGNL